MASRNVFPKIIRDLADLLNSNLYGMKPENAQRSQGVIFPCGDVSRSNRGVDRQNNFCAVLP